MAELAVSAKILIVPYHYLTILPMSIRFIVARVLTN